MQKATANSSDSVTDKNIVLDNKFYGNEKIYSKFGPFALPQVPLKELQYHNVCEIAICREGNGLWLTGEHAYSISEGDIIFAPPYTFHHTRSVNNGCLCEFAYFDEKTLLERNGIQPFTKYSADIFAYATIFREDKHPQLHFLLKHFIEIAAKRDLDRDYSDKASALWYSLFLLELQSRKQLEKKIAVTGPLTPAIEKIILNFSDSLTLEDLADACSLSRNRFIEKFKREYGLSPMKYLNNYRVNTAAHMLSESNEKILDICTFVGYNNPSELYRHFKQRYGLPPLEYRNKTKLDIGE